MINVDFADITYHVLILSRMFLNYFKKCKLVIRFIVYFLLIQLQWVHSWEEDDECELPEHSRGRFTRMGEYSKYIYFDSNNYMDYYNARQLCDAQGFEIAEVTSHFDMLKLIDVFEGWRMTNGQWSYWIGMNDVDREGYWKFADRETNATYQAFFTGEPDNYHNSGTKQGPADFVLITKWADTKDWYMADYNGGHYGNVICQYKKRSNCYKQSHETRVNALIVDRLDYIGSTWTRKLYATWRVQKNWYDAIKFCTENGMRLLDLDCGRREGKAIHNLVQRWMKSQRISTIADVWSSGKYNHSLWDDEFVWKTTGGVFNHKNPPDINFIWGNNEPADSLGNEGLETCIAMGVGDNYEEDPDFWLVALNCLVPRWFLCYKPIRDHKFEEHWQWDLIAV